MDEIKEILLNYKKAIDDFNDDFVAGAITVPSIDDVAAQLQALFDKRVEGIFEAIEKHFVTKNQVDHIDKKAKPTHLMRIADYRWQALKSKIKEGGE